MNQEKNLLLRTLKKNLPLKTKRGPYQWGLLTGPYHCEDPVTLKLKENSINENPQDRQWQKTLFGIFVMVYNTVADGDNFHMKVLVLEDLLFMLPVT